MQTTENATPNTLETVKKFIDMSQRDFIATLAMQGLCSNEFWLKRIYGKCEKDDRYPTAEMKAGKLIDVLTISAYEQADAIIAKSKENH